MEDLIINLSQEYKEVTVNGKKFNVQRPDEKCRYSVYYIYNGEPVLCGFGPGLYQIISDQEQQVKLFCIEPVLKKHSLLLNRLFSLFVIDHKMGKEFSSPVDVDNYYGIDKLMKKLKHHKKYFYVEW